MPVAKGHEDRNALLAAGFGNALDPVAFAEEVLGIDLNPAQQRWFRLLKPKDGWSWPNKVIIHVAANQIGKSLGLAIIMLWACVNKIGVPSPGIVTDPRKKPLTSEAWVRYPYMWAHVAPVQQQAYIPFRDISLIVKGAHPAQRRPCKLVAPLISETKIEGYYDGWELANGSTIQFRTTENKADALQGRRFAAISFDEAAFETHLKVVVNEVLMMRLIASGGPLLLVSTPNGLNEFYEFAQRIWQHPDVDMPEERVWQTPDGWALVLSHISDNAGYGLPVEEVERMERDLPPETKEQQLRGAFLEPAEAFFVPSIRILSTFVDLPESELPRSGHRYVAFWDVSQSSDPMAAIVLDTTNTVWIGVYFRHWRKPPGIDQTLLDIYQLHALYNSDGGQCITGYDATSMGGAMLRQSLSGLSPAMPLNLAGPTMKLNTLTNLRAVLLSGNILLPRAWMQLSREVLSYRLKDERIAQDSVMTLAGAAHIAAVGATGTISRPFRITRRSSTHAWR